MKLYKFTIDIHYYHIIYILKQTNNLFGITFSSKKKKNNKYIFN